jgi:hypothetical protein
MWCLHIISFWYGFHLKGMRANTHFREGSRSAIKISAVSLRSWDPIPLSHWDCGIRSRVLNKTAGSDPAVSMTPLNPLPRSDRDYRIFYKSVQVRSHCVIETAESELCKRLSRLSQQICSHMRNGFSPWIRALWGIVWWKNRGSKISWLCPFKKKV